MALDLKMLIAAALLALAQTFPYLGAVIWSGGLRAAAGNRQELPPLPEWAHRSERAQRNMLANLVPFAVLVLIAHQTGLANAQTASGAVVFFWARLAYAFIYIAGIPYLRTVAFIISLGGLFDVARVLLAAWGGASA
ncbi:MAG: MAPEG family protein [Candidatus Binatia bacterium]